MILNSTVDQELFHRSIVHQRDLLSILRWSFMVEVDESFRSSTEDLFDNVQWHKHCYRWFCHHWLKNVTATDHHEIHLEKAQRKVFSKFRRRFEWFPSELMMKRTTHSAVFSVDWTSFRHCDWSIRVNIRISFERSWRISRKPSWCSTMSNTKFSITINESMIIYQCKSTNIVRYWRRFSIVLSRTFRIIFEFLMWFYSEMTQQPFAFSHIFFDWIENIDWSIFHQIRLYTLIHTYEDE